jgi:hypothetical protein
MNWLILLASVIVTVFVSLTALDRRRLRRRTGMSKSEFVHAFAEQAVPDSIAIAVYDYYSSVAFGDRVAISPDDNFEDLRVGQDDLDDDLQRLVQRLGLEMPSSVVLKDSPFPIRAIRDVVLWLNWVRTHQTGNLSV